MDGLLEVLALIDPETFISILDSRIISPDY